MNRYERKRKHKDIMKKRAAEINGFNSQYSRIVYYDNLVGNTWKYFRFVKSGRDLYCW